MPPALLYEALGNKTHLLVCIETPTRYSIWPRPGLPVGFATQYSPSIYPVKWPMPQAGPCKRPPETGGLGRGGESPAYTGCNWTTFVSWGGKSHWRGWISGGVLKAGKTWPVWIYMGLVIFFQRPGMRLGSAVCPSAIRLSLFVCASSCWRTCRHYSTALKSFKRVMHPACCASYFSTHLSWHDARLKVPWGRDTSSLSVPAPRAWCRHRGLLRGFPPSSQTSPRRP